jgi:uncharacterized protein YecE (DUF72 family)
VRVAHKWRSAAPVTFQFCIKAWQLITHKATSPTYRRLRSPLPPRDRPAVGSFQQTDQVWQAWLRTVEVTRAVDARVIQFQCPKSFQPTSANLINLSAFFSRIDRESFRLAFEPRGEEWTDDIVRALCAEYHLIHCVDPFERTAVDGEFRYWRLHGRGSYAYRYTDADLAHLRRMIADRPQPGYLLFNNFSSKADALRFRNM